MTNTRGNAGNSGAVPNFELKHRLRLAREFAGLDQAQMYERTGLSRATISAAETGRSEPHPSTIHLWALATGVSYRWLTTGCPSQDLLATA